VRPYSFFGEILFTSKFRAVVFLTVLAGLLTAVPFSQASLLSAPLILSIPGAIRNHTRLALVGALLGAIPVLVASSVGSWLSLNGRLTLPLVLYQTPGVMVVTPGYDTLWLPWQLRSIVVLVSFLGTIDLILIRLLTGCCSWSRQTACAILLTMCLAVLLYPMTWWARVAGTSQDLLNHDLVNAVCVLLFSLLVPMKYLLLTRMLGVLKH
jgi:hypothetical protein